jgi:hypothetical protein
MKAQQAASPPPTLPPSLPPTRQSTYCEHLWNHCQAIGRPIHCVNLGGRRL